MVARGGNYAEKSGCCLRQIIHTPNSINYKLEMKAVQIVLLYLTSPPLEIFFLFTKDILWINHSLFVETSRVDGASLSEPSFFLFTTKTTGLSTRIEVNLNIVLFSEKSVS